MIYRILDANENKVGVPIKASSIGCKPILDNLEKKFSANETANESLKPFVKIKLDDCLSQSPFTMKELMEHLKQKHIYTLLRQNAEGRLYGITFVDNQNKAVFNGSDLGKGYIAAALQSRLATGNENNLKKDETKSGSSSGSLQKDVTPQKYQEKTVIVTTKSEGLLDVLLSTKEQYNNIPNNLLKKKRTKKRKHDF